MQIYGRLLKSDSSSDAIQTNHIHLTYYNDKLHDLKAHAVNEDELDNVIDYCRVIRLRYVAWCKAEIAVADALSRSDDVNLPAFEEDAECEMKRFEKVLLECPYELILDSSNILTKNDKMWEEFGFCYTVLHTKEELPELFREDVSTIKDRGGYYSGNMV